jgi:hypothetical protein
MTQRFGKTDKDDLEKSKWYKGILKFDGKEEEFARWLENVEEMVESVGGPPWLAIFRNEHVPIVAGNVRQIANELRDGTIDPTDPGKAGVRPHQDYYTIGVQTRLRNKIIERLFHIAYNSTSGEARDVVGMLEPNQGNQVRERLRNRWGKKQSTDKQKIQATFQSGITNPDGVTRMQERDDIKQHIERLEHMQKRLIDMTPTDERANDSTLTKINLMVIVRTSLATVYGTILAIFDENLQERQDINRALVQAGGQPMLLENDEDKFYRLKRMLYNFYEAKKREWEDYEATDLERRTPAMVQGEAPGGGGGDNEHGGGGPGPGGGGYGGISRNKTTSRLCWNFTNKGYCQYGDRCKFRHETHGQAQAQYPQQRDDESSTPKRCWSCNEVGHMKGSPLCKKAKVNGATAEEKTEAARSSTMAMAKVKEEKEDDKDDTSLFGCLAHGVLDGY